MSSRLSVALARVIDGDPSPMPMLSNAEHEDLRVAAASLQDELVVTRMAVVAVLTSFGIGSCSPEEAQAWASFVRRGYIAGKGGSPIQPVDIDYEEAWEDAIVEAVSRLDEIGDEVDGTVTRAEIDLLLQLLGVP